MADILIKNMEMPKNCEGCQLATVDSFSTWCPLKKCFVKKGYSFKECPLVEIKPHGDLCDKKVLYEKMVENIKIANAEDFGSEKAKEYVTMAFKAVLYELRHEVPTVLEASE